LDGAKNAILETEPMFSPVPSSQCLLIDADDTLWENNIYFERVITRFISFLNHAEYSPAQVREVLHEVGLQYIASHGYGTRSFVRALAATCERLSESPLTPDMQESILGLADEILQQPLELIAGVEETLEYLASRHGLILMTKGDFAEQSGKVERSGLRQYFSAVEIVRIKDAAAYSAVAQKHNLRCNISWMIGNSPHSDINPALAAGMNAVFVPHPEVSMFEQEALADPPAACRLLQVQSFAELKQYF
jgi:putative hydrolase of the HAD superfamily